MHNLFLLDVELKTYIQVKAERFVAIVGGQTAAIVEVIANARLCIDADPAAEIEFCANGSVHGELQRTNGHTLRRLLFVLTLFNMQTTFYHLFCHTASRDIETAITTPPQLIADINWNSDIRQRLFYIRSNGHVWFEVCWKSGVDIRTKTCIDQSTFDAPSVVEAVAQG